jgi:hypothetical protein
MVDQSRVAAKPVVLEKSISDPGEPPPFQQRISNPTDSGPVPVDVDVSHHTGVQDHAMPGSMPASELASDL